MAFMIYAYTTGLVQHYGIYHLQEHIEIKIELIHFSGTFQHINFPVTCEIHNVFVSTSLPLF